MEKAEQYFLEALDVKRQLIAEDSGEGFLNSTLALTLGVLASIYQATGRPHEARQLLQEEAALRGQLLGYDLKEGQSNLARSLTHLAHLSMQLDDHKAAAEYFKESLPHLRTLSESNPEDYLRPFSSALFNLFFHYRQQENHEEALALVPEATAVLRQFWEKDPRENEKMFGPFLYTAAKLPGQDPVITCEIGAELQTIAIDDQLIEQAGQLMSLCPATPGTVPVPAPQKSTP